MDDHAARKQRSHELLASNDIPFLESLPALESSDVERLRPAGQVAARAFCLVLVGDVALGNDPDFCLALLEEQLLHDALSERERGFLVGYPDDAAGRRHYAWSMEAAYVLLWALGRVSDLPLPLEETAPGAVYGCLCAPEITAIQGLVREAQLRDAQAIADQLDLTYRMHWSARHHPSKPLNLDVVSEWHRALNWLTFYGDAEWDDVTTDT